MEGTILEEIMGLFQEEAAVVPGMVEDLELRKLLHLADFSFLKMDVKMVNLAYSRILCPQKIRTKDLLTLGVLSLVEIRPINSSLRYAIFSISLVVVEMGKVAHSCIKRLLTIWDLQFLKE